MNWLRRQLPLLVLVIGGLSAVYWEDPKGLRAWDQEPTPLQVHKVALPADPRVPGAHGVLRLSPAWATSLLHSTGKHAAIDPPADPIARALLERTDGYVVEIAAARAFVVAYRTTTVASPEWRPEHPYRLALQQRREDLSLIAALERHKLGDAASLKELQSRQSGAASPFANRDLPLCIDALIKLEQLRVQHPPPAAGLSHWLSTWKPPADTTGPLIEELRRRAGAYRSFAKEHSLISAWVRLAADEAKQADDLVQALVQMQRNEKSAGLNNLQALYVILSALDRDRHPEAFARARMVIVQWCAAEAPADLPLDKVWIGSPRKTAFARSDVKIEWEDGTITTMDQPHRGIVYNEETLRQLDKNVKNKITITTPLGSGSPDDLIASEATLNALAFNDAARQLRQRLAEPGSFSAIAEAFRDVHKAGSRMDENSRTRLMELVGALERLRKWER